MALTVKHMALYYRFSQVRTFESTAYVVMSYTPAARMVWYMVYLYG